MLNPIETPWLLIGVAFAVWVVIVSKSIFGGMEKRWWHYAAVLAIVTAGIGIDYFFDSDLEAIKKQIAQGRQAVIQAEPEVIANLLSPAYEDSVNRSKAEFVALCNRVLSRPVIENLDVGQTAINLEGSRAAVDLTAFGKPAKNTAYASVAPAFQVKMELLFTRENGTWLIRQATLQEVNGNRINWSRLR